MTDYDIFLNLLEQAYTHGLLSRPSKHQAYEKERKYFYLFTEWIKKKGANETNHLNYFTKEYFKDFLIEFKREEGQEQKLWDLGTKDANTLPTKKEKRLPAPVIALFCSIVNDIGIIKKGEKESIKSYCDLICKKYKLDYPNNTRKFFYGSDTKENRGKLSELILPRIDSESRSLILDYLNTKHPPT